MRIGTCHFVSEHKAVSYYIAQGLSREETTRAVIDLITNGEIKIGKPELKAGETLVVIDGGTRYAIEDGKP